MRRLVVLRSEGGMTLIEMMIAISLLGIVLGPIMGAFMISLLQSSAARDRITDSAGAQIVSTYLVGDIQSARAVNPASLPCTPTATAGDATHLTFSWFDPAAPTDLTKATAVAYRSRLDPRGQRELVRATCTGTSQRSDTLARNMAATGGLVPTCDGATCVAGATPRRVAVQLTLETVDQQAGSNYAPLTFTIKATRRVGL